IASLLKYRIERALKRGNLSREDILRRIDLQWTDEQKAEIADHTIYNNGTEKELEDKIKKFHEEHIYRKFYRPI
ncbi:MAG: dephospho-CoA kinase, partial [Candidatus Marinimicrobia bacterium]|nr:dephospho-CoA kinase [Candidatus Neomarinimicrobiota bacterium]